MTQNPLPLAILMLLAETLFFSFVNVSFSTNKNKTQIKIKIEKNNNKIFNQKTPGNNRLWESQFVLYVITNQTQIYFQKNVD